MAKGVVAEHDLFLDRKVQLGRMAVVAKEQAQRVMRLAADLLACQEIVAPWLIAKISDLLQATFTTNAADHGHLERPVP